MTVAWASMCLLAVTSTAAAGDAPQDTVDYCQMFGRAVALNHRPVTVTADLQGGPHDDIVLTDARCPRAYVSLDFAPGVLQKPDVNRLVSDTVVGYPDVERHARVTVSGTLRASGAVGVPVRIVVRTIERSQ